MESCGSLVTIFEMSSLLSTRQIIEVQLQTKSGRFRIATDLSILRRWKWCFLVVWESINKAWIRVMVAKYARELNPYILRIYGPEITRLHELTLLRQNVIPDVLATVFRIDELQHYIIGTAACMTRWWLASVFPLRLQLAASTSLLLLYVSRRFFSRCCLSFSSLSYSKLTQLLIKYGHNCDFCLNLIFIIRIEGSWSPSSLLLSGTFRETAGGTT